MRRVLLCMLCILLGSGTAFAAAPAASDKALHEAVRNVLRENPELVLDVLRENSAVVLEIAQQGLRERQSKVIIEQWKKELTEPAKTIAANRPVRGAKDAPLIITAYSDFTCPFCQQASEVMAAIRKKYEGKIGYVFKHLPAAENVNAKLAAQYCAAAFLQDEAKGWLFYDALFARRELLIKQGEQLLKLTALEVGLDLGRLAQDVKSKQVSIILAEDLAESKTLNIKGTPSFYVGNKIIISGVLPEDIFSEAVDMALKDITDNKK